jgi:predicted HTH domain antitoxin
LVGDVNEDEARIALAAELYRERRMTLKQAADTAQLTLCDFLYELGKRKVRYTNITVDDLREELGKI